MATMVGFIVGYAFCVGATAHVVFGLSRTAATRLPIPPTVGLQMDKPLFWGDYTFRLQSYHGRWEKAIKILELALLILVWAGGTALLFAICRKLEFAWTGGDQHGERALRLHAAGWMLVAMVAVLGGMRGANRNP